MTEEQLRRLEGPALSCILATLCALSMGKIHDNWIGVVYWLLFITLSGLFIDPLAYSTIRQFLSYCLVPAIWLILIWAGIPLMDCIWGACIDDKTLRSLEFLLPIVFLSSAIGIPLGSLAKRPIIEIFCNPEKVEKAIKGFRVLGVLAGLVFTAIVVFMDKVKLN